MQIADHTFLVTGGGSGLGAACVRRFVAGGGRVVIADVQKAAGEALASELGAKAASNRPYASSAACTVWSTVRGLPWQNGPLERKARTGWNRSPA
jgi:NAD(P)-dependent dehydrogenase (short-subunit alcohol dehydrogenase family)